MTNAVLAPLESSGANIAHMLPLCLGRRVLADIQFRKHNRRGSDQGHIGRLYVDDGVVSSCRGG